MIGSWHSDIAWDVDIYHDNRRGDRLFSQIRNGNSVRKEDVSRVLLHENNLFKPMIAELCATGDQFYEKVNPQLRQVSVRC